MKSNFKTLALILGTAALVVGCATPVGTVYKYKYEAKNLLGTSLITNLYINDIPNDPFVEFETPTGMDFCYKGKLPAVKSIESDLIIFTITPKNTCHNVRFVVRKNGIAFQQELVAGVWKKRGKDYLIRD